MIRFSGLGKGCRGRDWYYWRSGNDFVFYKFFDELPLNKIQSNKSFYVFEDFVLSVRR